MNLDIVKKVARIDKKILYRKLKNKVTNQLLDKLYRLRDSNLSTYSFDYISYFRVDYSKRFDFIDLFEITMEGDDYESFTNQCIEHKHRVLSENLNSINSSNDYRTLQKRFNPKLIPFSTQCYNKISEGYKLIDWQKDFNSGFNWEFNWYKDIKYGNSSGNEIKVPWEIGRLQHLPMLALEFNRNQSVNVITEIRNQIFDFMASNPPNFGVQWMTSMDIGIRLVNILLTLFILKNNEQLFDKTELELLDSYLFDHYLHIKDNIEYSEGMRGNHYLSNLCSIAIYISFTEDIEGKKVLLNKYKQLLETELDYQFNEDGTNFEGSTRYHIFTNQMLLTTDLILKNFGYGILTKDKLNKISSFTLALLEYDFPPQIGDNDSGFYWKVLDSELITYKCLEQIIQKSYIRTSDVIYKEFGYIQRKYDNIDLLFKCGKLGQKGKGGHDHNDNLSYQLYINNSPFIVDIGSYCYTSDFELRNRYRSTKSHNVLCVSGIEQNEYSSSNNNDIFWVDTDHSNPVIELAEENRISGSIDYGGVLYKRNIEHNSNEISITDKYNSKLNKEINIYLFPGIYVKRVENNVYKLWNEKNTLFLTLDEANARIEEYEFSPQYGVKLPSNKIVLSSAKNIITHRYRVEFES